jgi:NAD(P)H-quinone oxidoreductase subunit 5
MDGFRHNTSMQIDLLLSLTALAVPLCFVGAAAVGRGRSALTTTRRAAVVSLVAAVVTAVLSLYAHSAVALISTTAPQVVVLLLVTFLAAVLARASESALRDEPRAPAYARAFALTLASVSVLVLSRHLLLLWLAWIGVSVSLHRLLLFFPDRVAAIVAARKKFIVSRLADVVLACGAAAVVSSTGSGDLEQLSSSVAALDTLPPLLQFAAVCFVVAAALKCAQLPFHGWLTQVMEAPTPVSALLHAGVVNMGGLLLLRTAPLLDRATGAQVLLLLIAVPTTAIAALVTTTRVSVKVALAWSTIAQMGFMLVECALGLWHLVVLHLVAHSLYKAHAFLTASGTVDRTQRQLFAPVAVVSPVARVGGAVLLAVAVVVVAIATEATARQACSWLLVAIAVSPLLPSARRAPIVALLTRTAVVVAATVVLTQIALLSVAPRGDDVVNTVGAIVLCVVLFAVLAVFEVLRAFPHSAFAQTLHPWLFSGLYLDEMSTRLTLRLWPLAPAVVAAPVTAVGVSS